MSAFLLSYFPHLYGWKFGNEFLVVTAHGAYYGFVSLQTLQRFLSSTIIGIAECIGELFRSEFIRQQSKTLLELRRAATQLCGITQLVFVVLTV